MSTTAIALLIIGLVVGAAAGYLAAPRKGKTVTTTIQGGTSTVTSLITQTITKAAGGAKTITITVWASGSPADTTRYKNIIKAAEILNEMLEDSGSPVRIQVKYQWFRGDYFDKLTAAFAANQAPDIIAMKDLPKLVEGGYVIQLDKYVEKYKLLLEDVYPSLWNATKYKGHIWALPEDTEARPLYYRKDVLREMGWSEQEIDSLPQKILSGEVTLQDLIKVAVEAKQKGLVKWGFYHRPNWGGTPFLIFYYQYGGIAQDPTTGKLVLVKHAALKTLELLYNMTQVYKVLPPTMIGTPWRTIHVDFVNGRVLFWFGGTWHWAEWRVAGYHEKLGNLTEEYEWKNIGFALVPAPEKGLKPLTLSSPYLYYVTSKSKYPEVAFLLILIATSPPLDAIHAIDSGHLPVRMTTVEEPYYKKSKFHTAVAYMLQHTSYEPLSPHYDAYKNAWIEAIASVEKGSATPQKALENMVKTLQSELGDQIIIRD